MLSAINNAKTYKHGRMIASRRPTRGRGQSALSWWRNAGAMGGGQGASPLRWDADGSKASPSAGPTTR